jgi:uncharacterized protein YndB with AHSA1/START domain
LHIETGAEVAEVACAVRAVGADENKGEELMYDIGHRVGMHAPLSDVYDALATREGVTRWWTRDVEGESKPGGRLAFGFGQPEPWVAMEVVELVPLTRVRWRCVEGPDEWKGTTITFELKATGDETTLLFTHAGWREPVEFMRHCSTKWGYFLLGLKAGFEDGKAAPWPNDMPVSSWG